MGVDTRILIVEDDAVIQKLLSEILASDFSCTVVSSCAEAFKAMDRKSFECALIDLGLPDGNGLSLLPDFRRQSPWGVPLILTADFRPETIVETLRAGAFDYLIKPMDVTSVRAAVQRALAHHAVVRERDELFGQLSQERELLQERVAEATSDLRQYATSCENMNERLQSLLRLTRICTDFYTDEFLFRKSFEEMTGFAPLECVVLFAPSLQELVVAFPGDNDVRVMSVEDKCGGAMMEISDAGSVVAECIERHTGMVVAGKRAWIYPQTFWGETVCTVAFYTDPAAAPDASLGEYFGMAAHFMATEWHEAQLLLHATKQASLGNLAMELSKGFIQSLTAIRVAGDTAAEARSAGEAAEALQLVFDNVDDLQRRLHEFRQLAQPHKDSFQTVDIGGFIDRALELLQMSIRNRRVDVVKQYKGKFPCALSNVTALTRTLIDLVSNAVHSADLGGKILVHIEDAQEGGQEGAVELTIGYDAREEAEKMAQALIPDPKNHPRLFLAQRTIRSCGGSFYAERSQDARWTLRVTLPKNAAGHEKGPANKRVSE